MGKLLCLGTYSTDDPTRATMPFIAAAGAYVSIRAQFVYRDDRDPARQRSAPRPLPRTAHAADHEHRRVVNG